MGSGRIWGAPGPISDFAEFVDTGICVSESQRGCRMVAGLQTEAVFVPDQAPCREPTSPRADNDGQGTTVVECERSRHREAKR